jgi:cytochrome c oxidase subunit 2
MTARRSCWYLPVATSLLGGCGEHQSVLNPMGPEALRLAQLTWLLFGFGAAVLGIVILAAVAAVRGPEPVRAVLASARMVVWAGIFFPAVALTGLLGYGVWVTRASIADPGEEGQLRIVVTGEQWWWRVHYPQLAGPAIETANEIRIPVGRSVQFELRSADVIHSFWVPNLGGKVDMIPGRATFLRLGADRAGVFRGQCAEYCGGPHALMAFFVIAMPPDEFDRWFERESQPVAEPPNPFLQRGRDLFLSHGCGGCHAVRGTPADGIIGPDLTHIGSRVSLAAGILPNNQGTLAGWIADTQTVKPNNLMPSFNIFAGEDLRAVAAWLESLK